jgi:hypothetical protein
MGLRSVLVLYMTEETSMELLKVSGRATNLFIFYPSSESEEIGHSECAIFLVKPVSNNLGIYGVWLLGSVDSLSGYEDLGLRFRLNSRRSEEVW